MFHTYLILSSSTYKLPAVPFRVKSFELHPQCGRSPNTSYLLIIQKESPLDASIWKTLFNCYNPSANSRQRRSYASWRPINRQKNTRKNASTLPRLFCLFARLVASRDYSHSMMGVCSVLYWVGFVVFLIYIYTDYSHYFLLCKFLRSKCGRVIKSFKCISTHHPCKAIMLFYD